MPEKTVTIRNKNGIHCRPSSCIITAVEKYEGVRFSVTSTKGCSSLSSILELLSLGLQCGDIVRIKAEGTDAENALAEVSGLFAKEFDFPPKQ